MSQLQPQGFINKNSKTEADENYLTLQNQNILYKILVEKPSMNLK